MRHLITTLVLTVLICSCSSKKYAGRSTDEVVDFKTIEASNYETTLLDYIRKLPGVTVRGSGDNITVRVHAGGNSFMNQSNPLFLIDGSEFSGNFQSLLYAVNPMDIKSVTVLKTPSEVGIYGVRGLNGVIKIKLK